MTAGARPAVALVTARGVDDPEDRLLAAALADEGVDATTRVWDDAVDWPAFALAVVRSTWDYAPRRDEFVAWAERAATATALANEPALLRWSTDKAYLADLRDGGAPIVPTVFLDPAGPAEHDLLGVEHVVKPAVSAGSKDTLRFGPADAERSRAHVAAIHASGRTAIAQPYLADVDEHGETALVFVDGGFSHAARKGAILPPGGAEPGAGHDLYAAESITACAASAAELAVGEHVLSLVQGTPLYARVDLLPTADGPLVLELELAEPSLFLAHSPGAAATFARAITARLER